MRIASLRLAPWIAALACCAIASAGRAQLTQAERDAMGYAHNAVRAAVTPYAAPALPAVSWSATREAVAQAWADACVFAHSGTPSVGENIYAFASIPDPVPRPAPSVPLLSWESERAYYNYAANSCSPPPIPGTCGHYTQVVWRTSTSIGCGLKYCEVNSPFGGGFPHWWFWVCQYSPAGNVGGQRPYLCDYDNNGSFESVCTGGIYVDGFEVGAERWSAQTP